MEIDVEDAMVTRMDPESFGGTLDFYQLRASFHVTGRVGDDSVDFPALGAAETFRGR